VVLLLVIYLIYRTGKKSGYTPTIISDSGSITQADRDKAAALAIRLKNDLAGISSGHDDTIYADLAAQSNTVFALTFSKYKAEAGTYLTDDINDDYFWGWDVIDVILDRAKNLTLV